MKFPRIIHQTYKTRELPPEWKDTPQSWKQMNPSFQYMFWTDKDIETFVHTHFPQYETMMKQFPYTIQRIDVVRYMWMYVYGGIYADLDLQCIRPIHTLLEFYEKTYPEAEVLLVMASNSNQITDRKPLTNATLISKPGASFWLRLLQKIKHASQHLPWYKKLLKYSHVMYSTGPQILTEIYYDEEWRDCGMVRRRKIQLIPHPFLAACSMCDSKPCGHPLSFVRVVEGSSWHNWEGRVIKCVYCVDTITWIWLVLVLILALLCLFLWKRSQLLQCEKRCPNPHLFPKSSVDYVPI